MTASFVFSISGEKGKGGVGSAGAVSDVPCSNEKPLYLSGPMKLHRPVQMSCSCQTVAYIKIVSNSDPGYHPRDSD